MLLIILFMIILIIIKMTGGMSDIIVVDKAKIDR